jgi:hypothetical protein
VLVLIAQASQLLGAALQVAGQLYIDNAMSIDEMPSSMRKNPLNVELTIDAQGRRQVSRRYQRPSDWIDAGRRISADSQRWLADLPSLDDGPRVLHLTDEPTSMRAAPVLPVIWCVAIVAGVIGVSVVVYASIQAALDVFALNAAAFDEELRINAAAFDARMVACAQLPADQRESCIERATAGAIENVRAAAAAHDRSKWLLGVLAIAGVGGAALYLNR